MIIFYDNKHKQSHIFNDLGALDTADSRMLELKMEYTKLTAEFQGSWVHFSCRVYYIVYNNKQLLGR